MIKALRKLGIEVIYLNIIKTVFNKLIVNIILLREYLKPFPLRSGMCPLSPLLFLEFLVKAVS
jgi:hypothetical protein